MEKRVKFPLKKRVDGILKEVNNHSSDPLKLFELFNNETNETLCSYGNLYIEGLSLVRKDLFSKFEDLRNSIELLIPQKINAADYFTLAHDDVMNFSRVEKNFNDFFGEQRLRAERRSSFLDNSVLISKESFNMGKKKEDDLLNFSHLGMSLLEVTDLGLDKTSPSKKEKQDDSQLDSDRILGDVLKIPDESMMDLLGEVETKPRSKTAFTGMLFPGGFDADAFTDSPQKSSKNRRRLNSDKLKKDRVASTGGLKLEKRTKKKPEKSLTGSTMFGRTPSTGGPQSKAYSKRSINKPPLSSTSYKSPSNYQTVDPRLRGSHLSSSKTNDYMGMGMELPGQLQMVQTMSTGYNNSLHPEYRSSYGSRHLTPDPINREESISKSELFFKDPRKKKSERGSTNRRSKMGFSNKSRSPKVKKRGLQKSSGGSSRQKSVKSQNLAKAIKKLQDVKPTRDTIPIEYHPLLIQLIDGVGNIFDFSGSSKNQFVNNF
jgi:hypothetical protein